MKSNVHPLVIVPMVLMANLSVKAATAVFKCTNNGTVTFQDGPCQVGEPRKTPTVDQLNADRQRQLREVPAAPSNPDVAAPDVQLPATPGNAGRSRTPNEKERRIAAEEPSAPAKESFKCDGRIYCSQMTSCAEAKYFLAHCPAVKMDGDKNGIPCEIQWCNR